MHAIAEPAREAIPVVLRPAREDEYGVVRDTWLNTCKPPSMTMASSFGGQKEHWVRIGHPEAGKSNYRWMAPSLMTLAHTRVIEELLSKCSVEVAVLPDLPEDLVGWVAFERPEARPLTIHYVYVLGDLRRHKIGTRLFAEALQTGSVDDRIPRFTHMTNYGRKMLDGMKR